MRHGRPVFRQHDHRFPRPHQRAEHKALGCNQQAGQNGENDRRDSDRHRKNRKRAVAKLGQPLNGDVEEISAQTFERFQGADEADSEFVGRHGVIARFAALRDQTVENAEALTENINSASPRSAARRGSWMPMTF